MKKIQFIAITVLMLLSVTCQASRKNKKKDVDSTKQLSQTSAVVADTFTTFPDGLQYKIIKHGTGTRKPIFTDHVEMNISVQVKDSVIYDSRKMYNNKPVPQQIMKPKGKGDIVEGLMMLVVGDSAIFRFPADSMKKNGGSLPPWAKEGEIVEYKIAIVSIMSEEELKKDKAAKIAAQKEIDEKLLHDYFTKNNITPLKTQSGLYYTIKHDGEGATAQKGNIISVFYTGKLLNGTIFDTNQDSTFHHQDPISFEIGKGKVIKGWDEGMTLLKKGSIATLYIPSGLAYGPQDKGGPIPPNSVLLFDIEVKDIRTQAELDESLLQEYFKKNNIKTQKTSSGLYYSITKKGKGAVAATGDTVFMNYIGKTLNGNIFDKNVDSVFHNIRPFSFALGTGKVIKGWDEGIALLNKGSKATFYIPSALAYGPQAPSRAIGANAVLLFDVELTDIKKAKLIPNPVK